jgi:hypothetical protein
MKLPTQFIKRSHDFLWSAGIVTCSALHRRLELLIRQDAAMKPVMGG